MLSRWSSRPLDKAGGRSPKKCFQPFGPQFGLKIRGRRVLGPWAPPLDPPLCPVVARFLSIQNDLESDTWQLWKLMHNINLWPFKVTFTRTCPIFDLPASRLSAAFWRRGAPPFSAPLPECWGEPTRKLIFDRVKIRTFMCSVYTETT